MERWLQRCVVSLDAWSGEARSLSLDLLQAGMARHRYVLADGQPFKIDPTTTAGQLKAVMSTDEDAVGVCELRDGRQRIVLDDHRVIDKVPPNQELRFKGVIDLTRNVAPCPECGGRGEYILWALRCSDCGLVLEDEDGEDDEPEVDEGSDEETPASGEGPGKLFG